jgi:hypothetical protein
VDRAGAGGFQLFDIATLPGTQADLVLPENSCENARVEIDVVVGIFNGAEDLWMSSSTSTTSILPHSHLRRGFSQLRMNHASRFWPEGPLRRTTQTGGCSCEGRSSHVLGKN